MKKFIVGIIFIYSGLLDAIAYDENNGIGYETVELILVSLKNDPLAIFSTHGGWTIVTQSNLGEYVLWSFTPAEHSAHPSAVRRQVIKKDGKIHLGMDVLCQANKVDCDQLVEEFKELNKNIIPDSGAQSVNGK